MTMTDSDKRQEIAVRLREARKLAGLSQGQAAILMKLHRPSVSEIEAGNRRVSAEELTRFASLYDVSIAYLTGDSPDSVSLDDPTLELAARELRKLPKESLEKLLQLLAATRTQGEGER
jgi:transcriptional regulator with XRE-family HTH domain